MQKPLLHGPMQDILKPLLLVQHKVENIEVPPSFPSIDCAVSQSLRHDERNLLLRQAAMRPKLDIAEL
jgi:hypothetical protein